MNKKDLEDQLEAFFEHNPLDDDMMYLKQFVKNHPENKMGWYLLGKEYAVRDKEGKAKYCFAQAGEVYEAFEKKRIKLGLLESLRADQTVIPGQTGRRKRLFRVVKLGAVLIIAMLAGSYLIPEKRGGEAVEPASVPAPSGPSATAAANGSAPSGPSATAAGGAALTRENKVRIVYDSPLASGRVREELWRSFLVPGKEKEAAGRTLLVEGYPTADGKWINGIRPPAPQMSGTLSGTGGELRVVYHQAQYCNCTPAEAPGAAAAIGQWLAHEEEDAVLRSAVRAYQNRYGEALPETIDGLIRDFPHNLLPGYTDRMKAAYPRLREQLMSGGSLNSVPLSPQSGEQGGEAGVSGPVLLADPLEIIIDRDNYRLALVSGSVILRSYPVGLGGNRTPEGTFFLSDKVKNPNGRDDGDFGSRGMQLSDTDYAIHGTNQPGSIEHDDSLGCVRMLKEDVEELFDMAPSGTKVTIGKGLLPAELIRKEAPFQIPALRVEENPRKVYRWL
ncbi:MAG: ErfK/YbiS/YcfS/YnhG family protein [Paenibacillaceae bacterium]|jgi:lipoprotein-anchoring transpeptidase ErfK/SrfK|nr:ErfK/YbiS/YcfS/YnhG family protein [Paenibacillaceae bacterium]